MASNGKGKAVRYDTRDRKTRISSNAIRGIMYRKSVAISGEDARSCLSDVTIRIIEQIVQRAGIYTDGARRKVISVDDVQNALRHRGRCVYL